MQIFDSSISISNSEYAWSISFGIGTYCNKPFFKKMDNGELLLYQVSLGYFNLRFFKEIV